MLAARSSGLVVFRVDASIQIGTGHVMRCLTLAHALRERGLECAFICRPHPGHLLQEISGHGFKAVALPALPNDLVEPLPGAPPHKAWLGTDWTRDAAETREALGTAGAEWLIVDHYALDHRWEQALRPACQQLMVMDDLADRVHDCDMLLDPSLGRTPEDYAELVPHGAITLLGPQYALLRPEFAQHRAESLARRVTPRLRTLLVTMGGVDKDNATGRVLDALSACPLPAALEITVVMGPHAPWLEAVRAQAAAMTQPTRVLVGVDDMARLMTDSDLAIGAAGSTSWERCCLGLPSFVLVLAENQHEVALDLRNKGAAIAVEDPSELETTLGAYLQRADWPDVMGRLSHAAALIADGGGAARLINRMTKHHG